MFRFFLFIILFQLSLWADPHWAANYENAFATAKTEQKGVMVMLSQENCKACWYMENIVFEEDLLVQEIEQKFVMLYLDVHDDDIHGLDFSGTPTFYFLTDEDKVIKRLNGVYNIKEMTAALLKIDLPAKEK